MMLQPSHLPSTSLCADDEQGKRHQYAAAQGFHSYLQVLLTWAVPAPVIPLVRNPTFSPPSAAGTPRSPENCCFPPHHCCSRTEQTTSLAEVSETREMPEVRIALGGSPGSERSCCSLGVGESGGWAFLQVPQRRAGSFVSPEVRRGETLKV